MASTTQAARVCEPKNRDLRPSLCGSLRSRMTVKVARPHSTPTENRSSRNPIAAQCPIPGIANVRENRSPYASMIVSSRTMNPQKVAAWAAPGHRPLEQLALPDHLRQLRLRLPAGVRHGRTQAAPARAAR